MKRKYWWIKERHNPQLGIYYVACEQDYTVAEALKAGNPLYGDNVMHKFLSEKEYRNEVQRLIDKGERVQ
jgi:hypothetical protein